MRVYVVDTETTGLDPEKDAVCEIASVEITRDEGARWSPGKARSSLVFPGIPIPPEASAVHHLVDSDLLKAPRIYEAVEAVLPSEELAEGFLLVAHNAPFDRGFLPMFKDARWIDTYRCALHLWPDAPSFKNQALWYWRGFERASRLEAAIGAHTALGDANTTADLVCAMLNEGNLVRDLRRLTESPAVLLKVGFGEHRGKPWSDLPTDYLRWMLNKGRDFDADTMHTARCEFEARKAA